MKRLTLSLALAACALLLTGCMTSAQNPLMKAEATDVPGLSMELHAAQASEANVSAVSATLYFRYLDEPLLAGEDRTLMVRRDESAELAIVRALLEGPSAGHSDLRRLFSENVEVMSVVTREDILYVTFNEALLTEDDVPQDWQTDPAWRQEAPLKRRLALQSVAASLSEHAPCAGVQFLVYRENEVQPSLRLENSYFLDGGTGLSEPVARDETLLLTPQHTAERILALWQARDYAALYLYAAAEGKPGYEQAAAQLDACPALTAYTASGGSVSGDGRRAVVSVALAMENGELPSWPLPLTRENGVWKITFAQLLRMMDR